MPNKKVLVVDDSPTDLKLMTAPLRDKGYEIVTASTGEAAMEIVSSDRPDLVVLDVILPGQNGFQVCREIKSSANTKEIKVLILTNKTQESDRFWGLKQGADDYLTKPFEGGDLVGSVERLLSFVQESAPDNKGDG